MSIGFVPTMGALHKGHASLLKIASSYSDLVVCSIFVNPTQFNDPTDLEKYPRQDDKDIEFLVALGVDVLYLPAVEDVYPPSLNTAIDVTMNGLDAVMEGKFRPGHFKGVLEVVHRLLDIVKPHHLYMGQKDYQQFTLIAQMIKQLQIPVELRVCPIVRANNGLALSSRNALLSEAEKEQAAVIFETLSVAKELIGHQDTVDISAFCLSKIEKAGLRPEYFEIVSAHTLNNKEDTAPRVACVAAYLGTVRLIDNSILYKTSEPNGDYFVPMV